LQAFPALIALFLRYALYFLFTADIFLALEIENRLIERPDECG
jgi:hypothetical protein